MGGMDILTGPSPNKGGETQDGGEVQESDLALEFAGREFFSWCDANAIDHAEEDMDEDDRKDFERIKKRFCREIRAKRLVVDGSTLSYEISKFSVSAAGEKITVRRPTGKELMAMDGYKETQQMQKIQAFIAGICGKEKSFVARLDMHDYRFLQSIAVLFLSA
jgi:hypothetical protein